MDIRLIKCDPAGKPLEPVRVVPADIERKCTAAAERYQELGYQPPWISYIAVTDGRVVGYCDFWGPPAGGYVGVEFLSCSGGGEMRTLRFMESSLFAIAKEQDQRLIVREWRLDRRREAPKNGPPSGFLLFGAGGGGKSDGRLVTQWI